LRHIGTSQIKERSRFLKKAQKRLSLWPAAMKPARPSLKTFFASFFKKEAFA
jgi:hypothetical protein